MHGKIKNSKIERYCERIFHTTNAFGKIDNVSQSAQRFYPKHIK